MIFYGEFLSETQSRIYTISPDGTGNTAFLDLSDNYGPIAPNPNVANQVVFAYRTDFDQPYRLYRGATLDPATATLLVSGETYDFVSSIQITPDGTQVVFTASRPSQLSRLYKVAITGAVNSTLLDSAESSMASINWQGTRIAYIRVSGGDGDVYTRGLGASDPATAITNNSIAEELWPQFSKDGSTILYSSDELGANFELYSIPATGGLSTRLTTTTDLNELAGSWSPNGSQIVSTAVTMGSDLSVSGLYRMNANGSSRVQIRSVPAIMETAYWTSADGRSRGARLPGSLNRMRHRR